MCKAMGLRSDLFRDPRWILPEWLTGTRGWDRAAETGAWREQGEQGQEEEKQEEEE